MVALAITCVFALPTIVGAVRSLEPSLLLPGGTPVTVGGQIAMSDLQPGACMGFAPRVGGLGKTVFIDPGHGGLDPGVVGDAGGQQILEKDATLSVGARLASLLEADGYRVVLSRTQDSSVTQLSAKDSVAGSMTASAVHRDLVTRAECANAWGAWALLSIHFDGFADRTVGGTETFYDPVRPFAAQNKHLASDLQAALVSGLGTTDRGVWTDDQLAAPTLTESGSQYGHLIELGPAAQGWVDDPSQMPGALVEPLFLTNAAEARIAAGAAGQQRIAEALKTGLEKYLGGS